MIQVLSITLTVLGISSAFAIVYDWAASQVLDKGFRKITEEERVELSLSKEEADEYKMFDPNEAGKYLFIMQFTYHVSWPIRKLVRLLN
jgi:hypothetical protein